ncbi:MAG: acetylglutamate kinase [Bacteroidia bacterium]
MKKLYVIKIGGKLIDDKESLHKFLKQFSLIKEPKILVHGGGKLATEMAGQLGINTKMVEGRRVTDKASLEVATMVYAGKINKEITAKLNSLNCSSIGLSGADNNLIQSIKRNPKPIDFGFVGDVNANSVNTKFLQLLLKNKITPVLCAITSDKKGQLLNTNADAIASAISVSMASYFNIIQLMCMDKDGVLNNDTVVKEINGTSFRQLKNKKVLTDGILPKIETSLLSVKKGVKEVRIGNAMQLKNLINGKSGTVIK